MYRTCTTAMLAALLIVPPLAGAAEKCPSELAQAKAMLGKATSARTNAQPSQKLAGAKQQDIQAPREQDIQAPKAQDIQAPRGQTAKASPDDKARFDTVRKLIQESEAACKKGDMAASSSKAREAMELLK